MVTLRREALRDMPRAMGLAAVKPAACSSSGKAGTQAAPMLWRVLQLARALRAGIRWHGRTGGRASLGCSRTATFGS